MFYSIITKARDTWFDSKDCHIKEIVSYMQKKAALRDAQIEAIKTYLYLKIKCQNKPLWQLFCEGHFNALSLSEIYQKLNANAHTFIDYLRLNKAALSLYDIALHLPKNDLQQYIHKNYAAIDYEQIFKSLFYNVSYTDYLFSLPMGAGKTYLMVAFIYLDLYFALNEPDNKSFAHNFLILAPSGLKSSIIPSLRNIKDFDVSWILPEPSASKLKKLMKFEILNQSKTNKKSNKIQNPNVAKIASYQPYETMFGVILLTNAEKVILEKLDKDVLQDLSGENEQIWGSANELRDTITNIPNLGIFIDEVHHATNEEIKLRQVVNEWNKKGSVNMVAGFSGTPYLKSSEKIIIGDNVKIEHKEISNIVYYYPLIKGIGNFLKTPVLKTAHTLNRLEIVEQALKEFLKDSKIYENTLNAKMAIYCGSIENLEEQIYPKVCEILADFRLDSSHILKFHKGNKSYPEPKNALNEFENLDSPFSKIKVILLVQIGKEGWDCKSLSGVVLAQEGDCPKNMVLQTACRCLRQVQKYKNEKALIYLNEFNAKKLAEQLAQEQRMSIEEFQKGEEKKLIEIKRYDRTKRLHLSPIDFYQLKLIFSNSITKSTNPSECLKSLKPTKDSLIIKEQDLNNKVLNISIGQRQSKEEAYFNLWLYKIIKESFHTLNLQDLKPFKNLLKELFNKITLKENDKLYFNPDFDRKALESSIRKAFCDKRELQIQKELIPQSASLLIASKFKSSVFADNVTAFIPTQDIVQRIIDEDEGKIGVALNKEEQKIITQLESLGQFEAIKVMQQRAKTFLEEYHYDKDKTYHYLPYQTDSAYEREVFNEILKLQKFKELDLEIYYNGDNALSDFKIQASYKNTNLGKYTPDFLILQRKQNIIHKILIVETKGETFAESFKAKKEFMDEFIKFNNEEFGYKKFGFLYLQDDRDKGYELIEAIDEALKFFELKE
ncbi:DEAD/DEAH box helicase [Helicobacter sp. MIT 14-3879]|uniref:DEAD/DEAH box helicase n=1 Tax=Helicobacter sp. MIT 14-3879 TaxID=2040649 RepID=UPI000E1E972E|nr:DEAD/DEAH box helicase family protein [Helicobacter sp. MIT 14-3879]RDU61387.1 type III restriction endonuclease subunit R [Helicobacter sp. MIT 14-3879]